MTEQNDFISDRQVSILGATRDIVCAALHSDSGAVVTDVLELLASVHAKITTLVDGPTAAPAETSEKVTAAQARKSITADGMVSFIDGKTYKTMRRHLSSHGETPESYRNRFGLPDDYPMVSAAYAKQRSDLAKAMGLGQMRREQQAAPALTPEPAPKKRRAKALEAA